MSGITFDCPECHQSLEARADMAGQLIDCPRCKKPITIPFPEQNQTKHMAFLTSSSSESAEERYARQLKAALAEGWIMISEGPSGAQLELPKKMKTQTKVALVVGFLLVFLWGLGLLVIGAALIDYAMQKKQTKFVSRLV